MNLDMSIKRRVLLIGYGGKPFLSAEQHSDIEVLKTQYSIVNLITNKHGEMFEKYIHEMHEDFLPFAFEASLASKWNEGVLICEKEIEYRGLHVENPKERFEL